MRGVPTYDYDNIIRKPSYRQFIADNMAFLLLFPLTLILSIFVNVLIAKVLTVTTIALVALLIYKATYIVNIQFTIMSEMIIYEHGIFHKTVDFLELYRVVDFQEESSLIQQLLGLKTVKIYSGDRSTPRIDMIGIKRNDNIIPIIRERVNMNRKRNGIYEIANRL